jgi:hypothetical protein
LPALVGALKQLSTSKLDQKSEARLWAQVAQAFIDYQFWQAVDGLVKKQIVGPEIDGVKGLYFENHTLWALEILGYVVIPYLSR